MRDWLDRAAARRGFDRAALGGNDGFIGREIERRMAERLVLIKHRPSRILDARCGAGGASDLLRARYPDAEIVALNPSRQMLKVARAALPLGRRVRAALGGAAMRFVQAEPHAVPLASATCDMVWSNVALAWSPDPATTLAEWSRVLVPGGLLMFTSFGPDTLKELASAFAALGTRPHVHPFVDMHDIGDMAAGAGFAQPVIDMEIITLTYGDPLGLFGELRAAGFTNAHVERRRGLVGRKAWQGVLDRHRAQAREARVRGTFEVVYGHAWKAVPRKTADGRDIIRLDPSRASRKSA